MAREDATPQTEDVTVEASLAESDPTDGAQAAPSQRRRRVVKWVAAAAVVILLVLLLLPVISVLQPGYYHRYPALSKRMDRWTVSTHSRISCTECHVKPGAGNFLAFAAKSVPAFYSQIVGGPSSTNLLEAPDRAACQKCHTGFRTVSPSGDLRIPHKAHVVVLGMQCVTCHRDLVHSANRRGFNRPEMETCLTCHNGDKAKNQCIACHTRKETPDSHKSKDWLLVHGKMTSKIDCAKCHDWTPNYCKQCHSQRPASHSGNWKKSHGPEAKRRGNGCYVCHNKTQFCGKCH